MTMEKIEDLYAARMTTHTSEKEKDFAQLDQGAFGTGLRYGWLSRHFDVNGKTVLDLGVGTGLMYSYFSDKMGMTPQAVDGVDMMQERYAPFMENMNKIGTVGMFTLKPSSVPFEEQDYGLKTYDLVFGIGVVGYYGLHTLSQLERFYTFCLGKGTHGALFIPAVYGVEGMGDGRVNRFDKEDLYRFIDPDMKIEELGRDYMVYW